MEGIKLCKFGTTETPSFKAEGDMVLRLEAEPDGIKQLESICKMDDIAMSVAFIGSTHSGKSTLIKSILGLEWHDPSGPKTAPKSSLTPTTGNVYCYKDTTSEIAFLDCEGDSGGNYLPSDINNAATCAPEYFTKRRAAVQEHLPRLAYVASDVIVYISMEAFASNSYFSKVQEVALSAATAGVVNAEAPCLILVHNQMPPESIVDSNALTKEFFDIHDPTKQLLQTYLDVRCIHIPYRRYGPEEFETQVLALWGIIKSMLAKKKEQQQRQNNQYSSYVWTKLLSITLSQFHSTRNLRMGNILSEAIANVANHNELTAKTLRFFDEFSCTHSADQFIMARECTLQLLACLYYQATLSVSSIIPLATLQAREEHMKFNYSKVLTALLELFRSLEPCQSTFEGKSARVPCLHTRNTHRQNQHHNPNTVIFSGGVLKRFIRKLINEPSHTWEGEFQFDDPEANAEQHAHQLLWHLETKRVSVEQTRIVQLELLRKAKNSRILVYFEPCYLCFSSRHMMSRVMPCGHYLCGDCLSSLRNLLVNNPSLRVTGVLDESCLIDPLICAICYENDYKNVLLNCEL